MNDEGRLHSAPASNQLLALKLAGARDVIRAALATVVAIGEEGDPVVRDLALENLEGELAAHLATLEQRRPA